MELIDTKKIAIWGNIEVDLKFALHLITAKWKYHNYGKTKTSTLTALEFRVD